MYKHILHTVKVLVLFPILFVGVYGSSIDDESDHLHSGHDWEIGLSLGYANLVTEKEEGINSHLHILRRLGDEGWQKYISLGLGAEIIVTDEQHYGLMTTIAFHPIEDLVLAISPGLEFSDHGTGWESNYATHIEMAYTFDVSEDYHLGPVIGYSKTQEAEHYTLGIHIGIPL